MLLVLSGVASLLLAARLVAALAGWDVPPISSLSTAEGEFLAAVGLIILILVVAALISAIPMKREPLLSLRGEGGSVLVRLPALRRLVVAEALQHPDVVRVEARLRERDGLPDGLVTVYARPLADAALVGGDVQTRVRDGLGDVLGRPAPGIDVRAKVLRVDQLKRYLP